MITEAQLHLITAAIDGELTPAEAGRLRHLLSSSPEARAVYARLKVDSDRLRKLPPVAPPANLPKRILSAIAAVTPRPHVPHTEPARKPSATNGRPLPRWVPVAIAASFLIVAAGGSYWFFTRNGHAANNIARNPQQPPPATKSGASDPAWANWLPSESDPRPSIPAPRERPDRDVVVDHTPSIPPQPIPPVVQPIVIAQAPPPRAVRPDLIGARPIPETRFDMVDVRLPFLKSVGDFDREEMRKELALELAHDPAYRVDVFTHDTIRAVDLFHAAAKATGLHVYDDATTHDRLKKRQVNAVVIYTEALTAEELAELFGKLAQEDGKLPSRLFDSLHAVPATKGDTTDLKNIFGDVDPGLFKHPAPEKRGKIEKPSDPSKPISAGTADQIVKSVTAGQGPAANAKSAVMMTWAPATGRTPKGMSTELKQFLSKRGDRKPHVVPTLIVIRSGNG